MLQLCFKDKNLKPIWLVDPEYSIGSEIACDLTIADGHLRPQHAKINVVDNQAKITNLIGDHLIKVNGVPVERARVLNHGDILNLGFKEATIVDSRIQKVQQNQDSTDESSQWTLTPVGTALAGREFVIHGVAILGRAKECDISLGIAHLSRKHARLKESERGLLVEDLKSANGTFVNGQRIEKAVLKPGDQVRFDTLSFQVSGPQPDLESTTVRPVLRVAEMKVRHTPGGVADKPATHGIGESRSHVRAKLPPQHPVYTGGNGNAISEQGKGGKFGMWLFLAVALCAAVWFYLRY
ncbi:FHA domain-containing protein [Teredinibacter haidensis]|uniref:FHA domain-containing protein n=1 Tax=Teredinibacter haidensis TaxID=2731755 RepID=UPI000948BC11|nr:FHA domain-containing protein [Teredinibacter haidensis]